MSATSHPTTSPWAALTASGALWPVLASALGRLPIAMIGLATLLYVQRVTGSFGTAGLVSAGTLVGTAVGSTLQGRLADRLGPTRPLLVAAVLFAAAVTMLVLAVEARASLFVLISASMAVGLFMPGLPGVSRALWSDLVPPGPRRDAAYNYEAISFEVFFILGPAIAALLATGPWAGTGLVTAGLAMLTGTVLFALSPVARARRPGAVRPPSVAAAAGRRLLGALADPGMRTVALASLGFGVVIGVVEVGVPASTTAAGAPQLGGVLLSLWSVTSVVAGLLYARWPWPRPLGLRMPALLAGFGLAVAAMAAANGVLALAALMLLAGCLITPQVTAHSLAVEVVAPASKATEAFGWVITAATLGLGGGQAAAGLLVEFGGPPAAFVAGGLGGLLLAAVLWVRRRTLAPQPATARQVAGGPA